MPAVAVRRQKSDPIDLHNAAQRAEKDGLFQLAGQLYREAASIAYTRSGAVELILKAKRAEQQCGCDE